MNWFLNGTLLATSASPGVGGCGTSVGTGVGKRKKKRKEWEKRIKRYLCRYSTVSPHSGVPSLLVTSSLLGQSYGPRSLKKGGWGTSLGGGWVCDRPVGYLAGYIRPADTPRNEKVLRIKIGNRGWKGGKGTGGQGGDHTPGVKSRVGRVGQSSGDGGAWAKHWTSGCGLGGGHFGMVIGSPLSSSYHVFSKFQGERKKARATQFTWTAEDERDPAANCQEHYTCRCTQGCVQTYLHP